MQKSVGGNLLFLKNVENWHSTFPDISAAPRARNYDLDNRVRANLRTNGEIFFFHFHIKLENSFYNIIFSAVATTRSYIFPAGCRLDIVFVLDNSNFLTPGQFQNDLMFVLSMVETLHASGSRFAVVSYSAVPRIHTNFPQDEVGKSQLQSEVRFIFTFQ